MYLNTMVIGNIGSDAVIKQTNGRSVINFNVAHTEKFKNAQGAVVEKTTWLSCAYWPENTKLAEYLKKGTQVMVTGTPDPVIYTKDGTPRIDFKLRVTMVKLLSAARPAGETSGNNSNVPAEHMHDNDLPFQ